MTGPLVPQKRLDRNGRLVTKHVKPAANTGVDALPAPVLGTTAKLSKARTEQMEWTVQWHRKYPTMRDSVQGLLNSIPYSTSTFECSDVEAYDVLSVSHGSNALLLLANGIRTKDAALEFYVDNNLDRFIEDNTEWVSEALARNIPAQPTLEMAGAYGSHTYKERPQFLDALEANGVRVLRDIQSYPTVPELIMQGKVNYADIKFIGATRLAKAARKGPVIHQLEKIHAGTSSFEIEALKKIILKYEGHNEHQLTDPFTMAGHYGAEAILNLRYFHRAADFLRQFMTNKYSAEERGKIITYNDTMFHHCANRIDYSPEDVFTLYDSGATVEEAVKGLRGGQTVLQVAAMAQSVPASVSSGWL